MLQVKCPTCPRMLLLLGPDVCFPEDMETRQLSAHPYPWCKGFRQNVVLVSVLAKLDAARQTLERLVDAADLSPQERAILAARMRGEMKGR